MTPSAWSLAEEFNITDMLGRGAFGAVFRATRRADNAAVAVKIVAASEANADVFFEVDVLKAIGNACPHIVTHLGSFLKDEQMCIALELADRGSLAALLRHTRSGLADSHVVGVVWQLAHALEFLHDSLLTVHLDVKADNLLLFSSGAVKLADFGSVVMLGDSAVSDASSSASSSDTNAAAAAAAAADQVGGLKREALLRGSPYWICPEIIVAALELPNAAPAAKPLTFTDDGDLAHGPITFKADVWSLGITIIELIDTKPPYFDFIPSAVLGHIADAQMRPEPTTAPVSDELLALVRLCLTRDVRRRPHVGELLRSAVLRRLHADEARDACASISPTQPNRHHDDRSALAASSASSSTASSALTASTSEAAPAPAPAAEELLTLSDVHRAMLDPERGIDVRRRFWRLTPYDNAFVGRDAVTWVSERLKMSRAEAVYLLRTMMLRGTFHHVTYSEPFLDRNFFYRFAEHDPSTSSATVAAERCPVGESELRNLIALVTAPATGVVVKDRRHHLRLYPSCFLGNELVDWICKHTSVGELSRASMRAAAVDVAQYLMALGLIEHVTKSQSFKDHGLFYRFCADTPEGMLAIFDSALATAKLQLSAEDVIDIVLKMRCEMTGIDRRDRKWRLRSYPLCFVGQEAVSWIVQHLPIVKGSRATAVVLGQLLLTRGVFHHVTDGHGQFEDAHLFYRFYLDERRLAREERELSDALSTASSERRESPPPLLPSSSSLSSSTSSAASLRAPRHSPLRAVLSDSQASLRTSSGAGQDASDALLDPFIGQPQVARHVRRTNSHATKALTAENLLAGAFDQRLGVSDQHVAALLRIVTGEAAPDVTAKQAATLEVRVAAARALIAQCFPHNVAAELPRLLKRQLGSSAQRMFGRRQRTLMHNRDALAAIVELAAAGHVCTHAELQDGDAVVERELARGASSVVYRATLLGIKPVALKRFDFASDERGGCDAAARRRFLREVTLLSLVRHPHIVPFIAAHTASTARPWIALELLSNGTLESMLLSAVDLRWAVRVMWAVELASALRFLHELDGVYRDVTPDNVLLGDALHVLLADFSSARVLDRQKCMTSLNDGDVPLAFVAPELFARQAAYDKPSDVYGFGSVLYEIAARKAPFAELAPSQIAAAVAAGQRAPPVPWPAAGYGELVEQCWAAAPAARPTMNAAFEALCALQRQLEPNEHNLMRLIDLPRLASFTHTTSDSPHGSPRASPRVAELPPFVPRHGGVVATSSESPRDSPRGTNSPRSLRGSPRGGSPRNSPPASPRGSRRLSSTLVVNQSHGNLWGSRSERLPMPSRSERVAEVSPRTLRRTSSFDDTSVPPPRLGSGGAPVAESDESPLVVSARRVKTPRSSSRARAASLVGVGPAAAAAPPFEITVLVGRRRRKVTMRLEPRTTHAAMLHAIQQACYPVEPTRSRRASLGPASAAAAGALPSTWRDAFDAAGIDAASGVKYAAAFAAARMDVDEHLLELTRDDMEELGVLLGDAKRLERLVAQLGAQAHADAPVADAPVGLGSSSLAVDSAALALLPAHHAIFVVDANTKEVVGQLGEADQTPYETHKALVASRIAPMYSLTSQGTVLSVLLLALASVSEAHFRLNYAPANLPIRNAPTATADGAWSTDQAGCGGEATWGKNGVTDVRAGDTITISFNYGTGASGDHRDANNRLRVVFVSLDDLANNTNNELARVRTTTQNEDQQVSPLLLRVLEDQMDASVGSRPEAYTASIVVPPILCRKCVLAALDQRNWGGCLDLRVVGTLPPATTVAFVPNVCGNGKVERDVGEQCELGDGCCTAQCKFGAAIDGCPCIDFDCESPFTCECADQETCTTRSPKCQRGSRRDSSAAALALAATAALTSVAAATLLL